MSVGETVSRSGARLMRARLSACLGAIVLAFVSGCNGGPEESAPAATVDPASSQAETCPECCTPTSRAALLRHAPPAPAAAPTDHPE
jgi:hypothetical protein